MEYALIKNSKVENVIVADPSFIAQITNDWDHIEMLDTLQEQDLGVGIGWTYDGQFHAPQSTNLPAIEAKRHISVGAFFDRFNTQKWPILVDTNPIVQALIKDCSVRRFIDLDDTQLSSGLELLIASGHQIDVQAILNGPIQPTERV